MPSISFNKSPSFLLKWMRIKEICSENLLLTCTISSIIFGILFGFLLRQQNLSLETIALINFPGEIFMQVLKLMILPLIFSSLIAALSQMDLKESKQMGLITAGYYALTTMLSIMTGITLVLLIHPGDPTIKKNLINQHSGNSNLSPLDTVLDVIRNMFPENVVQATFQRAKTIYIPSKATNVLNQTITFKKEVTFVPGMNILGVIVFCTGFGIVISYLEDKAKPVVNFFVICEAAIMKMLEVFMWLSPLGILSLISGNLLEIQNLSDTAAVLFWYVFTVITCLFIHTAITMPSVYFILTRKDPLKVVKGVVQAIITTFGTSSSGATLPITIRCVEENLKVDRRIARFVLPLGANINLDGNALYEAVAVIFIAQLNNVTLSFTEIISISFIATIASLGLNSVPAGLVTILVVLNTIGLPITDVSLIITVDWLLDRIRTAMTVLGDAYATDAVSHFLSKRLRETDRNNIFHREIQAEIRMLDIAVHSRRQSSASLIIPSSSFSRRPSAPAVYYHPPNILEPLNLNQKLQNGPSLQQINEI